jgi:hypothetical protein
VRRFNAGRRPNRQWVTLFPCTWEPLAISNRPFGKPMRVLAEGTPRRSLGSRLTAGQRILVPFIKVRILAPQLRSGVFSDFESFLDSIKCSQIWPHRLVVRTSASHAGNRGSSPLGVARATRTRPVRSWMSYGGGSERFTLRRRGRSCRWLGGDLPMRGSSLVDRVTVLP